jgi:MFS family permease
MAEAPDASQPAHSEMTGISNPHLHPGRLRHLRQCPYRTATERHSRTGQKPGAQTRTQHWGGGGYHRILSAQAFSALGDRISYVVVPFALLGIGFNVGTLVLVLSSRAVAYGIVVLYGGVLADRINCVRLMVTSDSVRIATQTATATMVFFHVKIVFLFILSQLIFGFAEACFKPSAGRLMAEVVPDAHLEQANGYYNSAVNFGMVFGPILGGLLVTVGSSPIGLGIDAATFLVSAVILRNLRLTTKGSALHETPSLRRELLEGWRILLTQRWVLVVMLASAIFRLLVVTAVFALGPAYAEPHLRGAAGWGILATAFGTGGILGGLASSRFHVSNPGIAIVISLIALSSQPLVLTSGLPYGVIIIWQLGNGVALTFCSVVYGTAMQRYIPRHALGRVGAFDEVTTSALMPLGYAFLGIAATSFGPETTMRVAGTIAVLCCTAALLTPSIRCSRRRAFPQ